MTALSKHKSFTAEVDKIAQGSAGYFDAVVEYCRLHNMELETAASLIRRSPTLKAKIESECHQMNLLAETTTSII